MIIALLLWITASAKVPSRELFWKVVFPVMETPAVYTATIDDKVFLVFVEYSDSLLVKGHYMALEATATDTLPFRLEARGRNARLYYNGERETFRPRVESMDERHAEGKARLSLFGTAHFHLLIHEIPDF
ncbi:MAG: hypothetical protein K6F96_03060 [Bacteroidales bacterium]|nr:hypothetical protein [Bacteroidales bacterium]